MDDMNKCHVIILFLLCAACSRGSHPPLNGSDELGAMNLVTTGCVAPMNGVVVTRTNASTWMVCTPAPSRSGGSLEWIITGDNNPKPGYDARAIGWGGIKLRFLYWNDLLGQKHTLLSCGNCDLIESVRLPGTPNLAWTGPGYGMESSPVSIRVEPDVAIGTSVNPDSFHFKQTVVGFAPGAPVTTNSERWPVVVRETEMSLTADLFSWSAAITVINDHELAMTYHGRLAGPTPCEGGFWDGFAYGTGDVVVSEQSLPNVNDCTSRQNLYIPVSGTPEWTELVSPQIRVRVINHSSPIPWRAIFNGSYNFMMKLYGLAVNSYSTPLIRMRGEIHTYSHSIMVH